MTSHEHDTVKKQVLRFADRSTLPWWIELGTPLFDQGVSNLRRHWRGPDGVGSGRRGSTTAHFGMLRREAGGAEAEQSRAKQCRRADLGLLCDASPRDDERTR
jgi:hypothetical protein